MSYIVKMLKRLKRKWCRGEKAYTGKRWVQRIGDTDYFD